LVINKNCTEMHSQQNVKLCGKLIKAPQHNVPDLHWPQKELRNFGRVENRNSWREKMKMQIKLASTCNKNETQQDVKNNAEL
jgi:hypothetical protein